MPYGTSEPPPLTPPPGCDGSHGRGRISRGRGGVSWGVGGARLPPLPKDLSPLSAERILAGSLRLGGEGGKGGEGQSPSGTHGTIRRLAVVGVGREGRGDDGAGPALCAELARRWRGCDDRLALDAGIAPENVGGSLRRFHPDVVLMVDAADMGESPGAVRRLAEDQILGCSASTHTVPLGLVARYLSESLGCQVRVLGLQADRFADGPLSDPVRRSVSRLARHLAPTGRRLPNPKRLMEKERPR
jgi:hydrogenase 3 maturation protease